MPRQAFAGGAVSLEIERETARATLEATPPSPTVAASTPDRPAGSPARSSGGPGIAATGNSTIVTRGTIRGGLGGDGSTRADAVDLTNGGNTLTLENGYAFVGNVVSAGGDTLALGGTGGASFDLAQIGVAELFRGFDTYAKTGAGTWTLTDNNTAPAWRIQAGTLQVDGAAGNMTVAGGTLAGTGSVAAIALNAAGAVAPSGSAGTLDATSLEWNAGGSADFDIGSTSGNNDRLALSGAFTRGSGGNYFFHFSNTGSAPQPGNTYTLVTFASSSGFSASDFRYDYAGTGTLQGHFVLDADSLQFVTDASNLTVTLSDDRDHARYGQVLNYFLTVTNTGTADATGVSIDETLSPQFDAAYAQWRCFSGGGTAQCTASGTGPLSDSGVVIPASRSVTWLISAPVLADAVGGTADNAVRVSAPSDAGSPHDVSDSNLLVLWRDGFETPYGDITALSAGENLVFTVPSTPQATPIDTLLAATSRDGPGFRVERLVFGATSAVRIVEMAGNGAERADGWVAAAPGERLAIGLVDTSPHPTIVLESAREEHLFPLSIDTQTGFDVRIFATDR